jgi:hypothetical protein
LSAQATGPKVFSLVMTPIAAPGSNPSATFIALALSATSLVKAS